MIFRSKKEESDFKKWLNRQVTIKNLAFYD